MVQFQIGINNDDLGITPIENIFINHYLPKAPGDFVKVYLLGLKFCFQNAPQHFSNEVIAKTLDILESDVVKAWQYWEKQGIIPVSYTHLDVYKRQPYYSSSMPISLGSKEPFWYPLYLPPWKYLYMV